jgi:hypothetical protein
MNMLYYLVPVVGIAGMLFYTRWAQANVRKRAAAGEGPQMFHDSFADKFEVLAPDERLIGMWMGLAYITPDTTVGQVAATVAKEMALAAINRSTYTPTVYVGLTTHGRVLVSEEYTEMGRRNNFKVVCALPAGARVVSGQAAKPDHQGAPPRNTYSADAPMELVRLVGQDGQYLGWLSAAGSMTGASTFLSITSVLPITREAAASVWQRASKPVAAA